MKKSIFLVSTVILSLLAKGIVAETVAPDFTLTDIDGVEFSLNNFRGRVVLLDFFATWCSVCVAGIPHLKSLHNEFGEDLVIISISIDPSSDTVEKLQQFRQTHQLDWAIARDTIGVNDQYSVPYIPTLVIIDQEGYIRYQHSGSTDESALREKIYEIMHERMSILSPENKTYRVKDVHLIFVVSEAASWIGYSLDGRKNVTIVGNTTLVGLSDGVHTVVVYANDTGGNMGSSDMVYFTVDTLTPEIEILSPKNKTYPTNSVPLSFTISEATSWIGYSLDGQANVTVTGNTTLYGLSDGSYSLMLYARDIAGNTRASEIIHFGVKIQAEPFPILIVPVIVAIPIVAVALLVYFTKVRKNLTLKMLMQSR